MNKRLIVALATIVLGGCGPANVPGIPAAIAIPQAGNAEPGVIVGVRQVSASMAATVPGESRSGPKSLRAFAALHWAAVGAATERPDPGAASVEYIVRKASGGLISVTQKDKSPLVLGQTVLVVAGNQALIVANDTVLSQPVSAAMVGTPSSPEVDPLVSADTIPAQPALKVDGKLAIPVVATPETILLPNAPRPEAAPAVSTPETDSRPVDATFHAS
jgi:outer membrane lipoprotein SlyB